MKVEDLQHLAKTYTIAECAKILNINYDRCRYLLRKANIKPIKKSFAGKRNANYKHGLNRTRLHHIYLDIKQRCYNPQNQHYFNYGGRGITMCVSWYNNFMLFYQWSKLNGYADNLTIDRIDVNGNYSPENCRWVTRAIQNLNRRSNRLITYKGKTQTLKEWAKEYNMNYDKLRWRLDNWKDLDKVFMLEE